MLPIMLPVDDEQQELGSDERGNEDPETEVHCQIRVDPELLPAPRGDVQSDEETGGQQEAISMQYGMELAAKEADLAEIEKFGIQSLVISLARRRRSFGFGSQLGQLTSWRPSKAVE